MKWSYLIALLIFALTYGSLNFYIGWRGWQAVSGFIPSFGWLYWLIFWFVALSYIIGRLSSGFLPASLSTHLIVLGSYWLAGMFYLVIILALIDLTRVVDRKIGFLPTTMKSPDLVAVGVILFAGAILLYGSWNARHLRITTYNLEVPKSGGVIRDLHIVAVSDIHLGNIVDNSRLRPLVQMVNTLQPDLVLLPGDIIDENIKPFLEQKMPDTLRQLNPQYGMYAVLGNHEYKD